MGTMVKMYIHVLLVDIHESLLFRKCESDSINEIVKCSNALLFSDLVHLCVTQRNKNNLCYKQVKVAIYTSMGYRQTVEIQIRFSRMCCLIRKPWDICYT